jgi:hypothetical protein
MNMALCKSSSSSMSNSSSAKVGALITIRVAATRTAVVRSARKREGYHMNESKRFYAWA